MKTEDLPYWRQFLWLGLGMLAYTVCRVGFPVGLNAMQKEFSWTAFEVGVLSTIFLAGQALIDIPAGFCMDRLDRKRMIFIGLFGLGLFTVLVTLSTGFWSALIFRVLFGLLEGVYNVAQFAIAGSILPGNRALVNGLTQVFYGTGIFAGQQFVSTILKAYPGYWQLAMWWLGGLTMVYAVISLGLFRRDYLRRYETSNEMSNHGFWKTLGLVVRNPRVWKAMSIGGTNTLVSWAVLGLGNYIFIHYRHYEPTFSTLVFGLGYGAGALFCPLGTVWADHFGRRPVICVIAIGTALAAFLLFNVVPQGWAMIVLAGVISFGTSSNYSLGYTICQDAVATASMSGIGIATGLAGGFSYLIALTAGPITGALIPAVGGVGAINLVVSGGEVLVAILAFGFLRGEVLPKVLPQKSAA